MSLDEKTRTQLTKLFYRIVNDTTKKYVSETVRIRYNKDIRPKVIISQINLPIDVNLHKVVYEILKSTKVLEEDPEKPRDFITTKSEWNKFYRNYLSENF